MVLTQNIAIWSWCLQLWAIVFLRCWILDCHFTRFVWSPYFVQHRWNKLHSIPPFPKGILLLFRCHNFSHSIRYVITSMYFANFYQTCSNFVPHWMIYSRAVFLVQYRIYFIIHHTLIIAQHTLRPLRLEPRTFIVYTWVLLYFSCFISFLWIHWRMFWTRLYFLSWYTK